MQKLDSWLLPEGISEVLPDQAARLEALRRKILDTFDCWGYQLVIPPFVDYLHSLLTGSGHDLELQTFKLTDQLSGKMLGVRADMTPQVARIDAHHLQHEWPSRLCYTGTVLHTVGDPLDKSRSPMQIGAELYGHSGVESDYEVIQLMLEMLAVSGIENVHLDLGHVGIYRTLIHESKLAEPAQAELFDVLQRKARAELLELLAPLDISGAFKDLFQALLRLNGDQSVLDHGLSLFQPIDKSGAIANAISDLQAISRRLKVDFPALTTSFDLAELRGYHYHTGTVFSAFVPAQGKEIARGGRYDNIGQVFGRARAATGFSADLKVLAALDATRTDDAPVVVFAPYGAQAGLLESIRDLRAQGTRVIQCLPGQQGGAVELGCNAILEQQGQAWSVKPLSEG